MNHSRLEKFAIDARKELIEKVSLEANKLGVYEDKILKPKASSVDVSIVNGIQLDAKTMRKRETLVSKVKTSDFEQVMEEVAYTWFNRFLALRFMEVHDYLPVRVLSSSSKRNEPDIMFNAPNINWDIDIDVDYVLNLKANNEQDELFKHLILKVCNELNKYLPFMFGSMEDYMEILFPSGLLNTDSFLMTMVDTDIFPESEWKDVEIIGWLYQYYISEENKRVISSKKRYTADDIPAATQIFTPDWIVRYMVQNTLGRYWVENHPEDEDLIDNWEFYLKPKDTEKTARKELGKYKRNDLSVEEIKCIDPAMGSGHILVYMFEVLYEIYAHRGYPITSIPKLIIENNLYGLDIDDRARQLACFSVVMKGMEYNQNLLQSIKAEGIDLNLYAFEESNNIKDEDIAYLAGTNSGEDFSEMSKFVKQFTDAKEIGTLLNIKFDNKDFLYSRLESLQSNVNEEIGFQKYDSLLRLFTNLIKLAEALTNKYDIFVTNPPYLSNKRQSKNLKNYLMEYYKDYKYDTFAAFMVKSTQITKEYGHIGFMTPYVWMFISSYEDLRKFVLENISISTLVQLEYSGFASATVPVCTFTLRNYKSKLKGEYIRLTDFVGAKKQPIKTREAVKNPNVDYRYSFAQSNFQYLPTCPLAYWAPKSLVDIFENEASIGDLLDVKQGLATADNNRFLRLWWEVDIKDITFNAESTQDAVKKNVYWVPYNKGGKRRQWYGNYDYVVNWKNDGYAIKNHKRSDGTQRSVIRNPRFYFKEAITWGLITSGGFSIRYREPGSIHDVSGMSAFSNNNKLLIYILGISSTKVANYIFKLLNPTLNLQVGDFKRLPIVKDKEKFSEVKELVLDSIDLAKQDWDSFETAWDFQVNPLLTQNTNNLAKAYELYKEETNTRFEKLKLNEERLNKIVIPMYGLENQLSPDLGNEDITFVSIHDNEIPASFKNNEYALTKKDVVKNFISYAIGCIFGRYSLDERGLVYTGGDFDLNRYKTFTPVEDNILFLSPDFDQEGDLLDKFVEFVEVALGSENLDANLRFIAEALGKKRNQSDKEAIKDYLLNKFYKDHAKSYHVGKSKNRPIYWQFASTNRQNSAFNALIYMHRYDKYTLSRIRTDYLHKTQERLDNMYREYTNIAQTSDSKTDVKRAKKKLRDIDKSRPELKEYDEKLHHLADQQIELDLNDGFKQNYPKFEGVVKEV